MDNEKISGADGAAVALDYLRGGGWTLDVSEMELAASGGAGSLPTDRGG
jgi:hypothetical protein